MGGASAVAIINQERQGSRRVVSVLETVDHFWFRLVKNSYSWTEINISYKIFDLVQYPRHLVLWSQIIDGKYYGVELPYSGKFSLVLIFV